MTPDSVQIEPPPCQKDMNHVITKKELNKKQEKPFIFKNLLELAKTNTIAYYQETLKLLESEKEHLLKIKLGRMALTDFQKNNLDKLILLNEYEINKINSLEPYVKQENIDIYYNSRMKKIREFQEKSNELNDLKKDSQDKRAEVIAFLQAGYKLLKNNRVKLINFLNRNKSKMQGFNITEAELYS
jgi:hypothetical protein